MRKILGVALVTLLSGCFSLDTDGDGIIDVFPAAGFESDELACRNGRDDDQDGRIDCQDTDCLMHGFCGIHDPLVPPVGYEDTFETCSNGIDDDEDGQTDCGDRVCQAILELCCVTEVDDLTCSDRVDNDGNGFADCGDFSCRNGLYVTVCEAEINCDNGLDDDGDRFPDCRDSDCADHPNCAETACADGVDNDGDDLVDCADDSCAGTAACPPEGSCTDGMDGNANGRTDCADVDCYADPTCLGVEDTLARCQDGNDNDGNGFVDCGDFGCSRSTNMAILDYCASTAEGTLLTCMDGDDNDGNGFTDCDDFACSDSDDPDAVAYCDSIGENNLERCSDDEDNDLNGFTDCGDFSCSQSDDPDVIEYCRLTGELDFANCTDRIDNDGNGFTDCGDFSCRFTEVTCPGACGPSGECPSGLSCYRGTCIGLSAPCAESTYFDDSTTLVGDDACMIDTESTRAEQVAMSVAACTDGLDNDGDGFTDCEDWECNHNPRVVDSMGRPICRYAGGKTCLWGANAGNPCSNDGECDGREGACSDPGPANTEFVCP